MFDETRGYLPAGLVFVSIRSRYGHWLISLVQEALSSIATVRTFGGESYEKKRYEAPCAQKGGFWSMLAGFVQTWGGKTQNIVYKIVSEANYWVQKYSLD